VDSGGKAGIVGTSASASGRKSGRYRDVARASIVRATYAPHRGVAGSPLPRRDRHLQDDCAFRRTVSAARVCTASPRSSRIIITPRVCAPSSSRPPRFLFITWRCARPPLSIIAAHRRESVDGRGMRRCCRVTLLLHRSACARLHASANTFRMLHANDIADGQSIVRHGRCVKHAASACAALNAARQQNRFMRISVGGGSGKMAAYQPAIASAWQTLKQQHQHQKQRSIITQYHVAAARSRRRQHQKPAAARNAFSESIAVSARSSGSQQVDVVAWQQRYHLDGIVHTLSWLRSPCLSRRGAFCARAFVLVGFTVTTSRAADVQISV